MSKQKYFILPDVHGSDYWKTLKDKVKDKNNFVLFLGDYLDGYGEFSPEQELNNFKEILEFKKQNPDNVILLLGNHDINQYIIDEGCSRKNMKMANEIKKLFLDNIKLFKIVHQVGDYICSHAGITKTWMQKYKLGTWQNINTQFEKGNYDIFKFSRDNPWDIYGDDPSNGCMWCRPEALLNDLAYPKQIVGHTKLNLFPKPFTDKQLPGAEIYFVDRDKVNKHHLELDF